MSKILRAHRHYVLPLVIAGGAMVVQRGVLQTSLLGYDGYVAILTSRIRGLADFLGTFTEVMMDGRLWTGDFYRPVGNLFLAFDYALWGIDPFGYQATSLLLWGAIAGLLYALMRKLLGSDAWIGATVAALFFALHPAALSVLPYPARRTETLMLGFEILALWVLPVTPKKAAFGRQLAAGGLAMLAVASKESGVVAVWLIVLHQACLGSRGGGRERLVAGLRAALPAAVLSLTFLIVRSAVIGGWGGYQELSRLSYLEKLTSFVPKYLSAVLCTGSLDTPDLRFWVAGSSVVVVVVVGSLLAWTKWADGGAQRRRVGGLSVLALGWLMPSLLIACASIHFSPRYALPMLAAFAMILGALGEGVGALLRRARGRERCFAVGSGLALLVVCGAALHGSPPITPYPELAKATKIQTDLLASIKQRLGTASSDKSLSVDLPRKVMVSATAVDHLWMMAPWTLEAWLELEYPERRFEVRRVEAQGKSSQRVWSVMVIPRRLDTL